ncbi:tyrosine-type recombinase/integrase [Arcobacter sp. YIC-464]|uniref:tyrosine-type recombinase/integrase n=1 Tax=Arcobacter sp. YIC-464 TaxID=3376631 RepID=UPI003C1F1A0B
MKYPLDCETTFSDTYLFWLSRFIRSKITSLSNRQVKDKDRLAIILKELITGYKSIDDLKLTVKEVRNIGINSIHVYYIPLEKLYRFMINFGASSMKEIDEELLSDFLATETSRLSDATKKNYRISLVTFFGYIDKQNEEDNSYVYRYGIELKNWGGLSGKSGTKLPSFMQKDEVKRFIEGINEYPFSSKVAARNRLVIKTILYTGIRVSEAINIDLKDFNKDGDAYIIQVRGKGNKPRVVMIKENIIKSDLNEWLDIKCCENNLLFCNQKGKALSQAYISSIVEKILLSVGIRKEKNGAHMLRHTFATLLYQKNKDLILVQESLGHADINTSRIYTHFDKDKLEKTTDIF